MDINYLQFLFIYFKILLQVLGPQTAFVPPKKSSWGPSTG